MAFAGVDDLVIATNAAAELGVNKVSIATQISGSFASFWRATGYPAQAAIPTTWAICNNQTLGAMPLPARAGVQQRLLSKADLTSSVTGTTTVIEERLGHMGGLSGVLTTAQTVNADMSGTTSNLALRKGLADYSELRWWLEWYTATGTTAISVTCAVTYVDDSTGTIVVAVPASTAAGRKIEIMPINGKFIKSLQTAQGSVTSGTAGNYGVTVTRNLARSVNELANKMVKDDWVSLGLREVPDEACVQFSMLCMTTSTGSLTGSIYMAVR